VQLDIRGSGVRWRLVANGRPLIGWYTSYGNAVAAARPAEARLRAAAGRRRACLCCAATFRSEGPHHRLCDTCRHA